MVLGEISGQIKEASEVAVVLDETSVINMVSQVTMMLRYSHDGKNSGKIHWFHRCQC